jgi:hypothetical protein
MPLAGLSDPFHKIQIKHDYESSKNASLSEENETTGNIETRGLIMDKNDTTAESSSSGKYSNESETEIEIKQIVKEGCEKPDPSHFEILKVLGQGSFGKVFLVKKTTSTDAGTLYAMKVLRKATLKSNFSHPLLQFKT